MEREKIVEFKNLGKEVTLKVLEKMDKDYKYYKEIEDHDGMLKVKEEFIPRYEKLYEEFSKETSENLDGIDEEKLEDLMEIINNIMKLHNLDINYILGEVDKRKALAGKSGSETVKELFKFQIKELEKVKVKLLEKANKILDREEKLEKELRDAIQEDKEMEILEKLGKVRREWGQLEEKVNSCQDKLEGLKETLNTKWKYEIYGTVSQKELKKVFKKEMGKN